MLCTLAKSSHPTRTTQHSTFPSSLPFSLSVRRIAGIKKNLADEAVFLEKRESVRLFAGTDESWKDAELFVDRDDDAIERARLV